MQTRSCLLALLLTVAMLAVPAARAQDYAPADPASPLPLYHDRPESGGLFVAGEFIYYHQTNPIKDQAIAIRGFFDVDGSVGTALGLGNLPGRFIGSGSVALVADDVGPSSYAPGWAITAGWRFQNGAAVEATWKHLATVKYPAGAAVVPFAFEGGRNLTDTFLTAPVFNFPPEFAGEPNNLSIGNNGATFGIWNAATDMSIEFSQRFDQYDLTGRIPVFQTDNCRWYGIVGTRAVALTENFRWRTVDRANTGVSDSTDVAIYSNSVSNRMYGIKLGCGTEYRLGDTPAGTFAIGLDPQVAGLVDIAHMVAKYERGDHVISAKRSRRNYTLVPELEAQVNLWWYPIEGIQVRIGYDVMAFFNTISSPYPVSFNFGGLDATYQRTFRLVDGLNIGIGFVF